MRRPDVFFRMLTMATKRDDVIKMQGTRITIRSLRRNFSMADMANITMQLKNVSIIDRVSRRTSFMGVITSAILTSFDWVIFTPFTAKSAIILSMFYIIPATEITILLGIHRSKLSFLLTVFFSMCSITGLALFLLPAQRWQHSAFGPFCRLSSRIHAISFMSLRNMLSVSNIVLFLLLSHFFTVSCIVVARGLL